MIRGLLAMTLTLASALLLLVTCSDETTEQDYAERRQAMVTTMIEARGIQSARLLDAMRTVPRHRFLPKSARGLAYLDSAVQIGWGASIDRPYVVARMTEAVAPQPTDRCLEIGTGSGYHAALLAELCAEVVSVEYVAELAAFAAANLRSADYRSDRVAVVHGDGYWGWPERAPFDVIVVTAAVEQVPPPLLDQLAVGGRLIAPVGGHGSTQGLELWSRDRRGGAPDAATVVRLGPVPSIPILKRPVMP